MGIFPDAGFCWVGVDSLDEVVGLEVFYLLVDIRAADVHQPVDGCLCALFRDEAQYLPLFAAELTDDGCFPYVIERELGQRSTLRFSFLSG